MILIPMFYTQKKQTPPLDSAKFYTMNAAKTDTAIHKTVENKEITTPINPDKPAE